MGHSDCKARRALSRMGGQFFLFAHPCGTLLAGILMIALLLSPMGPPGSRALPALGQGRNSASIQSIVPAWSMISDREARLELARLLAQNSDHLAEARRHYELLLREEPGNPQTALELAGVLRRQHEHEQGMRILRDLARRRLDSGQRLELAAGFAAFGHAVQARAILLDLLAKHPRDGDLIVRGAGIMLNWGDFYQAESLLRKLLDDPAPADVQPRTVRLQLSATLLAAQRHEQAEGLLRGLLLDDPSDPEAWSALVRLRLAEQDFEGALEILRAVPPGTLEHAALLRFRALIVHQAGDLETALEILLGLAATPDYTIEDELALARILLRLGQADRAAAALASILDQDPEHLEARFLWMAMPRESWEEVVPASPDPAEAPGETPLGRSFALRRSVQAEKPSPQKARNFVHSLDRGILLHPQFTLHLREFLSSPARLAAWGDLYARAGASAQARQCYLAALEMDRDFFPARLGLAEIYAAMQDHDSSLDELNGLLRDLPLASKLLLTRARVLSWSRRYAESLEAYDQLHALRPEDPVPLREAARAAMWAKQAGDARDLYRAMQVSGALRSLIPRADVLRFQIQQPRVNEALGEVIQDLRGGRAYPVRERLATAYAAHAPDLAQGTGRDIERLLTDLLPAYRVQQRAFLEERAKMSTWERRPLSALDAYAELLEVQPGNQEALFDLAQTQCSLGLHDQELETCRKLLNLDPLHGRAGLAVERIASRSRPALRADYGFWHEQGRGGARLSAMRRHQGALTAELPLRAARYRLFAAQHVWSERPGSLDDLSAQLKQRLDKEYSAQGRTIGLRGILTPWLRGHAAFTRKTYAASEIQDHNLGLAGLEVNLRDAVSLGVEYERRQELSNGLVLNEGIVSDVWRLTAASRPTRRLDLGLSTEYADMSDENQGLFLRGDLGLALTDHPRELKITLTGEHRHFREESRYFYAGPNLVRIEHPYWTPRNYSAAALTLQWRHDLAEMFFCGARQHWYLLKASAGTDTDDNPALRLEGEYHVDLGRSWSFSLRGLLHRSRQWNAEGVWAGLNYRF